MDLAIVPKLAAAFALGAVIATPAHQASSPAGRESVKIQIEWVTRDGGPSNEKLTLRTVLGETTVARQGDRQVQVTPLPSPDGVVDVRLSITGTGKQGVEQLDTQVHAKTGETNVVMASTKQLGRGAKESLLFVTAERL